MSGWDSLQLWDTHATRIEKCKDGVANDVWKVRINGEIAIARLGKRSDADLDWETRLLNYLDEKGMRVPVPIPTLDGKLFSNGLVVMKYLEGSPPQTEADWRLVATALKKLHQLTKGWTQRPGWRSSRDLLQEEQGTKVNLAEMPEEAVARCRKAWKRLTGPPCVVHGDPNQGNVLIHNDNVALIDWDESHLDMPVLDLVLPFNAADLPPDEHDRASQASSAWEAAVCWDDDYSKRRLAEVRDVDGVHLNLE